MKRMINFTLLSLSLFILGCANSNTNSDFIKNYKLNNGDYNSVQVTIDGVMVLESNDKSKIEKIIKEINTSKREIAQEIEFENPPEGLITLIGENELKIAFFKESSRTLYGDYYIHTDFEFQ
jgi:thioredoxin-related protein